MKKLLIFFSILLILYWAVTIIVPPMVEKSGNGVKKLPPYQVSEEAQELYNSLDFVADLHCDALLWGRDLTKKSDFGHVDFPRMQQGNVAMEVFTIVSKSPKGQNMEANDASAFDNITLLNVVQGRPLSNWTSLMARTMFQSNKMAEFGNGFDGKFIFLKSKEDVEQLMEVRKRDRNTVGGMLGIEGAHALEGKIENLERAYNAGVRLIGPSHFFDNELGGSAHGRSGEGLTPFGQQVIKRMNELNMIIDLAHASPKMIDDILAISTKPPIVSHTGLNAILPSPRNLTDDQIKRITAKGGLIGIAFFGMAVGDDELTGIVACMKHMKELVGVEYIALGSDYDGSVEVPFDITGLPIIVDALLKEGFTSDEIKAIMGENVKRYLLENL